jgi:hypothetical protein
MSDTPLSVPRATPRLPPLQSPSTHFNNEATESTNNAVSPTPESNDNSSPIPPQKLQRKATITLPSLTPSSASNGSTTGNEYTAANVSNESNDSRTPLNFQITSTGYNDSSNYTSAAVPYTVKQLRHQTSVSIQNSSIAGYTTKVLLSTISKKVHGFSQIEVDHLHQVLEMNPINPISALFRNQKMEKAFRFKENNRSIDRNGRVLLVAVALGAAMNAYCYWMYGWSWFLFCVGWDSVIFVLSLIYFGVAWRFRNEEMFIRNQHYLMSFTLTIGAVTTVLANDTYNYR